MEAVKKSVYLDCDVDEALKASAASAGRSVTKQMNMLLRLALSELPLDLSFQSGHVTIAPVRQDLARQVTPDPKVKSAKKLTSSKKLT